MHLKDRYYETLLLKSQNKVWTEYMKALLSRCVRSTRLATSNTPVTLGLPPLGNHLQPKNNRCSQSGQIKVAIWSSLVADLLATILVTRSLQVLYQKLPCDRNGRQAISNHFHRLVSGWRLIYDWSAIECWSVANQSHVSPWPIAKLTPFSSVMTNAIWDRIEVFISVWDICLPLCTRTHNGICN